MMWIGLQALVASKPTSITSSEEPIHCTLLSVELFVVWVCIKPIILGLDMAKVMNVPVIQLVHLLIASFSRSFVHWFIHTSRSALTHEDCLSCCDVV